MEVAERVLDPKLAGYIRKKRLERLLRSLFGGTAEEFNVRVGRSGHCCQPMLDFGVDLQSCSTSGLASCTVLNEP